MTESPESGRPGLAAMPLAQLAGASTAVLVPLYASISFLATSRAISMVS
jgi:hypothetical protein